MHNIGYSRLKLTFLSPLHRQLSLLLDFLLSFQPSEQAHSNLHPSHSHSTCRSFCFCFKGKLLIYSMLKENKETTKTKPKKTNKLTNKKITTTKNTHTVKPTYLQRPAPKARGKTSLPLPFPHRATTVLQSCTVKAAPSPSPEPRGRMPNILHTSPSIMLRDQREMDTPQAALRLPQPS